MGGVLFCASSDERRYGKFTVVLAQIVTFPYLLEERRDNAGTQFWHMAAHTKRSSMSAYMQNTEAMTTFKKDVIIIWL